MGEKMGGTFMDRKATAVWQGDLFTGKGTITTDSGILKDAPYTFKTRFEGDKGTNPEELLAAAHAGCFTMALDAELTKMGIKPEKLETEGKVSIEQAGAGFTITKSYLDVKARVPGVDQAKFEQAFKSAEKNCPVSNLFKAEIKATFTLEG
jgi:osmotically inducible protein OsmC